MNETSSLLRDGETILELDRNRRVGTPSQNFAVFRIGLIQDKDQKYARVKLPETMWQAMQIEAKMVINNGSIVAILLRDVTHDSPEHEIFAVRQPTSSRKDKPYIDMPVGSSSKMMGNRYPKDASSFNQDGWWRVDIPGSVSLKKPR